MDRSGAGPTVEEFLAHYGVPGMRWGIRRTDSGGIERTGKRMASEDFIKSRQLSKKRVSELSNNELKQLNERMNLEQNYTRLMNNQPNKIAQGSKAVSQILSTANKAYAFVNSPAGKSIVSAASKIVS